MNITRAQGLAALKWMEELAESGYCFSIGSEVLSAIDAIGWTAGAYFETQGPYYDLNEVLLALAMVVAISGVET